MSENLLHYTVLPHRVQAGGHHTAGRRDPAELREIGVLAAGWGKQRDLRAGLVEGFAILGQEQVIDPRAAQRHRALPQIQPPDHVAQQLGVEVSEIHTDSSILDDLGADSLDVVELVMQLEDEFDIEVPDEEAQTIRTVADVERYVASHIS